MTALKKEQRKKINKRDKNGTEIAIGDAFEHEDMILIVTEDETGEPFMRVFENMVLYGVEEEPVYREALSMRIEDMQFEFAEIAGNIIDNKTFKELAEREYNPQEEKDEYDCI